MTPSLLVGSHWDPTTPFQNFIASLRTTPYLTRLAATSAANRYLTDLRTGTTDTNGNPVNLLPGLPSTFTYADPSDVDLTTRRSLTQTLLAGASPLFLTGYWEVFYFVPVQLALVLQQVGQYEAALDWLTTVYDIDQPLVQSAGQWSDDGRKIFFGLSIERSGNPQFITIPGSLAEDSNPHDVAVTRVYPYTRYALLSIVSIMLDLADTQFCRETAESVSNARELYLESIDLLDQLEQMTAPVPGLGSNPQLAALQQRAQSNLGKMRSNRNIAGLVLQFDLFGTQGLDTVADRRVSLEPTQYHYSTLIERAKQIVALAQQAETSYLGDLANEDNETYNLMKAQGDLSVANATVTLLGDQVTEATDSIAVANDQLARANDEQTHYQDLIKAGLNEYEQQALNEQHTQLQSGVGASLMNAAQGAAAGASAGAAAGPYGAVIGGIIGSLSGIFSGISTGSAQLAQIHATEASYERRQQEWEYQLQLAKDDVKTATAQVLVATDQQTVVKQQQQIATIQQTNAQDIVNFLSKKFTNADLYDWMSWVRSTGFSCSRRPRWRDSRKISWPSKGSNRLFR